jgi:hypothetical protein
VTAPCHSDGDNLAVYVIFYELARDTLFRGVRLLLLFHEALSPRGCLILRLKLRATVQPATSCFILAIRDAIIGHARPAGVRVLGGRKDRG